jgi:L-lactate dehydrogenase complex protein LldF
MTTSYAQHEHTDFTGASLRALDTPTLQTALERLGGTLAAGNRAAWEKLPQSDLLRERARQIKDETLARLDHYLAQAADSVERAGGQVHWAADAAEAREIVLRIASERGVKRIVKSKSMTSEEIHLNSALEAAGLAVVETDFGEFIAQAARQRPSHLVAPIIHMTVEQVANVLSAALGRELPPDPKTLAAAARQRLREEFRNADMGVSGANFVVADTGTICIISNEGNARLTTTVPPVHVAIAGIEKVIPRLADLPIFLKLLARGATGQKMSVYTSLITGPRRLRKSEIADLKSQIEPELDGPREFHLIFLDNGRSRILAGPYRESLYCIRCGACLNTCPVYRKVGGHAYGGVYAGPIGAVITPLYDGLGDYPLLPHASSLCGACQAACPLKIRIPHMLINLRKDLHDQPDGGLVESLIYRLWTFGLRSPRLYRAGLWLASRLLGGRAGGWFARMPGPLAGWTHARDFPAPATRTFRDRWDELREDEGH